MLILALLSLPMAAQAAVRPVQGEIVVADIQDKEQTALSLDVQDRGGRRLYRIDCRREAGVMMACSLKGKAGRDLLGPRARFLPDHVLGPCANDPAWGRVRRFRVEDFSVTLSFSDIIETRQDLVPDSYHFRIAVKPWTAEDGGEDKRGYGCPLDLPLGPLT